jgi:hypothetical protein
MANVMHMFCLCQFIAGRNCQPVGGRLAGLATEALKLMLHMIITYGRTLLHAPPPIERNPS